jgi:hypothetical protein
VLLYPGYTYIKLLRCTASGDELYGFDSSVFVFF